MTDPERVDEKMKSDEAKKSESVVWEVWIAHEAFGTECLREYVGTELGAKRLALRLARAGGFGWRAEWYPRGLSVARATDI